MDFYVIVKEYFIGKDDHFFDGWTDIWKGIIYNVSDKKECKEGKCTPEDKCCDDCSGEPSKGKECCVHDAAATDSATTNVTTADTTVTTEVAK